MKLTLLAALFLLFLLPVRAFAMFSCEGSLQKENFADERKQVQKDLQKKILDYRKLEKSGAESAEAKAQLPGVMAEIQTLKKTFKDLDSKYFPTTPVTAFGAACQDMRWLEQAKSILIQKPEQLGKHWYVWLDKSTRTPKGSVEQPSFAVMAE